MCSIGTESLSLAVFEMIRPQHVLITNTRGTPTNRTNRNTTWRLADESTNESHCQHG